ncbi:MAG: aspartate dehydrogenase [Bacteroidetes bacterium]|nr:aspartate dehydrogenase [Bacteroidota bacterium]
MTLKLGLIGFGVIGRAVAQAVQEGTAGDTQVVAVLVRDAAKHSADAVNFPWLLTDRPDLFFRQPMDLVAEAAGHEAVRRYVVETLRSGRDFLTLSVGAFADESLLFRAREAATASERQILVPSGAIGGLDAITAAAVGGLEEVTITTRKPPRAWKGTAAEQQVDLESLTEAHCLYEGPARRAALLYPQNVNVQAALALAGIGLDRTRSRIYADPTVRHNSHEIVARGAFGEVRVAIGNVPSEGSAKTGRLTAMSMVKAIRHRTAPLVVGL